MKNKDNESQTPGQLIRSLIENRKKAGHKLSVRRLAKMLEVSAAFLSKVLNDKVQFPLGRIDQLAEILGMDELDSNLLRRQILEYRVGEDITQHLSISRADKLIGESESYVNLSEDVLRNWFFLVILDLTTCVDFKSDISWIANRLSVGEDEVEQAIEILIAQGLLRWSDGVLVKTNRLLRFPNSRASHLFGSYHKQILERALVQLDNQTDEAFDQRLICGVSFAANPSQLPKAKTRLHQALYEVAEILSEGPCTEVFHVEGVLIKQTADREDVLEK